MHLQNCDRSIKMVGPLVSSVRLSPQYLPSAGGSSAGGPSQAAYCLKAKSCCGTGITRQQFNKSELSD